MTRRPPGLDQRLGPWLRSSQDMLCPHPQIPFLLPTRQLLVYAHFHGHYLGLCPGLSQAARSPISWVWEGAGRAWKKLPSFQLPISAECPWS